MELDVVDTKNQKIGSFQVSDDVFCTNVNEHLLHEVIVMQLANRRRGTASTKIRDEVRGGGSKPWSQKGTGRARAGSSRSPLWRGGGVVFGPKPRSYSYKVPKKIRKTALKAALSLKVKNNDIIVLDKLEPKFTKTKEVARLLKDLNVFDKALFLIEQENRDLQLAARNLPNASVLNLVGLNVYDLLYSSKLILTQGAVSKIEERLQ
jgi:large subunit ribosomal protein L4